MLNKRGRSMKDKILNFIQMYLNNVEEAIKKSGKEKTISAGLNLLIDRQSFTKDELRKELSIFTKRIISVNEFDMLLDYNAVEYSLLLKNEENMLIQKEQKDGTMFNK